MPQNDMRHYLMMANTDARLKRRRHGHRHKLWRDRENEPAIIIVCMLVAVMLWVISEVVAR
jgi:hypothetical protein